MINKVNNNCSFNANLESSVKIANKTRYKNIQELFKNATKQYPQETLHLSEGKNGKITLHTTHYPNDIYGENINTNNLNEYMKTYTDKEIVHRLASAFKVLRLIDISTSIRNTIQYNKDKLKSNTKIATNLRKLGRDKFAEKYELFAQFNKEKIQNLNTQFEQIKNNFNRQKTISSKQFPEVNEFEL